MFAVRLTIFDGPGADAGVISHALLLDEDGCVRSYEEHKDAYWDLGYDEAYFAEKLGSKVPHRVCVVPISEKTAAIEV